MYEAYKRIFKRCGLEIVIIAADSGAMGGDVSHEFLLPAEIGEDAILQCPKCKYGESCPEEISDNKKCPECKEGILEKKIAIELGHVFQLGTKYSQSLEALYLDEQGKQKPIIMGCYGIGVSRLIAAIIETHNDEGGIKWPKEVAPFDVEILPLQVNDQETMELTNQYYKSLQSLDYDVIVDDRDETAGRKFNDADLIGIPTRIVLGKRGLKKGKVELKNRATGETSLVGKNEVVKEVEVLLKKG